VPGRGTPPVDSHPVPDPEESVVTACPECRVGWGPDDDPACTQPGHEHAQFVVHRHRTPVVLPDGVTVSAVSFDARDPYGRDEPPDFGLYLDHRWRPPWPHVRLDWPDFGVPADRSTLLAALRDLRTRAEAGERVEIGCLGAHGRTGTALAALAVLAGHPADDAVAWVRAAYCAKAIETHEQEAFVRDLPAGGA
jgi:hypothetical protein